MNRKLNKSVRLEEPLLSELISKRAVLLWEEKGKPASNALDIWFQAEKEIKSQLDD